MMIRFYDGDTEQSNVGVCRYIFVQPFQAVRKLGAPAAPGRGLSGPAARPAPRPPMRAEQLLRGRQRRQHNPAPEEHAHGAGRQRDEERMPTARWAFLLSRSSSWMM